ncbi:hypothetical protein I8F73_00300 [Enterococcus faecalis]|nr:hypothetical protein [Enterococcus faecalis]
MNYDKYFVEGSKELDTSKENTIQIHTHAIVRTNQRKTS